MMVRSLRCPAYPRTKFAEVWLPGDPPTEPVLIRVACHPCRKARRASRQPDAQVIHVFDGQGEFQTTDVEPLRPRS